MDATTQLLLLACAALAAGVLNAIAGGGTFLTFPALVYTGVPPIAANANQPGDLRSGLPFYPLECPAESLGDPVEHLMRRILDSGIANG